MDCDREKPDGRINGFMQRRRELVRPFVTDEWQTSAQISTQIREKTGEKIPAVRVSEILKTMIGEVEHHYQSPEGASKSKESMSDSVLAWRHKGPVVN